MNMRVLICGIVGGVLATVTLSLPLYLALPYRYSPTWPLAASDEELGLGWILSPLAVFLTGCVAARWTWAESMGERLKAGAVAGFLTAFIAFPLLGAPAAGVAGTEPVWANGAKPADSDEKYREEAATHIVAETVVRVGWLPYLTFWGMFLVAGACGALGGAITHLRPAEKWGDTPPQPAVEPVDISVAVLIGTSLMLLADASALSALAQNCATSAAKYGFELSYSPTGVRDWPVGMCFLLAIVATASCGRWSTANWNHPIEGVSRTAKIGAGAMVVAPLTTLFTLYIFVRPNLQGDVVFIIGVFTWVLTVSYWMGRIKRLPAAEPFESKTRQGPTARDRLLFNAAFLGTILPGLMMVTGTSQALSLALGVVPFLTMLFGRLPPGHNPPDVDGSISFLYSFHFVSTFYIATAWIVVAVLHAGLVVGWNKLFSGAQPAIPLPPASQQVSA